ncbi:MAG: hypothetical protein QWI73_06250 [Alphaproteobacteria bacterium]|nr:hypothetical protein [Alphaproteobacteria bacterium]MDN5249668.1 hypothetical protein [Alphaproteobacteria bacterium]
MGETESMGGMKNLMIHSGIFELYLHAGRGNGLSEVLSRLGSLHRFDLIEVANARLCAKILIRKNRMPAGDVVELFWVCCLLSKKFWNDTAQKNAEEIQGENSLLLDRVNVLERQMLAGLDYSVGRPLREIEREIHAEASIDKRYRQAVKECLHGRGWVRRLQEVEGS